MQQCSICGTTDFIPTGRDSALPLQCTKCKIVFCISCAGRYRDHSGVQMFCCPVCSWRSVEPANPAAGFDYAATVSALSDEQRLRFYESLAHNLTISIRGVWDNDSISDTEKVSQIRCINEILHRVTSKIRVTRRNLHEWSESDMWGEIQRWIREEKSIAATIGWAIHRSIEYANADA